MASSSDLQHCLSNICSKKLLARAKSAQIWIHIHHVKSIQFQRSLCAPINDHCYVSESVPFCAWNARSPLNLFTEWINGCLSMIFKLRTSQSLDSLESIALLIRNRSLELLLFVQHNINFTASSNLTRIFPLLHPTRVFPLFRPPKSDYWKFVDNFSFKLRLSNENIQKLWTKMKNVDCQVFTWSHCEIIDYSKWLILSQFLCAKIAETDYQKITEKLIRLQKIKFQSRKKLPVA